MIAAMLGRFRREGGKAASSGTPPARPLVAFWSLALDDAFAAVGSSPAGLSSEEARGRLARLGPNALQGARRTDDLSLLVRQFGSPIVLILVFATILSGLLGDARDATIILAIIVASGVLGFWQERGATRAVEALLAVVQVEAEVRRDGRTQQVPLVEVVPGDVVVLNAGDVAPGDCLIVRSRSLLVDEATLTGESFPVEKAADVLPPNTPLAGRTNAVFLGTHVVSGSATVLVMRTGRATELGAVSGRLRERSAPTGFERGMTAFGYLLLRIVVVLVAAIFVVNLVLGRPLLDSALFSLALAVGLTPQLLPAIVTISLSQGARLMAHKRVIVKRLDVIEDFGAMSILCTDKTGTMTTGEVRLESALGADGAADPDVLRLAALNAHHQTGFSNPIDAAILAASPVTGGAGSRLDELPYDFRRRRLSVLVGGDGPPIMITKGALESVLDVCTAVAGRDGSSASVVPLLPAIRQRFASLSEEGLRVLGVASRELDSRANLTVEDEAGMTFRGFLAFLDPPKPGAHEVIGALAEAGVSVRMVTGDNHLAAAHVGAMVGLPAGTVLTGEELDRLSDAQLRERAPEVGIFAEVDPAQKERIIRALRAAGDVVGYLGDGINDAPALHAADVGISVDSGVDVAKEGAAIVLLDKDLGALLDGVREGRRTFANTMKYVKVTTSANFGNVVSMAAVAAFLPFLPLLAEQILLVNLLTDLPATTIATDAVDPEQTARPHHWDIGSVQSFMILFGVLSSVFDLLTFAVLRLGFQADAVLFRSGWFLESVATELAVLLVLRTHRPFLRSRPSALLAGSTLLVGAITLVLPFSPAADVLGLTGPSPQLLAVLGVITALYVVATELAKRVFYRAAMPDAVRLAQGTSPD
jgi:Mg2+-importing ATPase